MNLHGKIIIKCLILLSSVFISISCRSTVKSQQSAERQRVEEAVCQQVINKAYQWLSVHPINIEAEGRIPVIEEMDNFYVLWKNTKDTSLKNTYYNEFRKRMDLIASTKDYQIQPAELDVDHGRSYVLPGQA